jgi:hypothetical protein
MPTIIHNVGIVWIYILVEGHMYVIYLNCEYVQLIYNYKLNRREEEQLLGLCMFLVLALP